MESPGLYNKTSTGSVISALEAKRGYFLEIILLLVVGLLFYFFMVTPKVAELASKNKQYDEAKTKLESLSQEAQALQNLSEALASHQADIKLLDQGLPLGEWKIRTQRFIEKMITSSGALLGDATINGNTNAVVSGNVDLLKNPYGTNRALVPVIVSVGLSGNFQQLYDTLKKIENNGRLMDISSLTLAVSGEGSLNMRLTLVTYYFGSN